MLLLLGMLPSQNTLCSISTSPLLDQVDNPAGKLINPASRDNHARHGIDEPDHQRQETAAFLADQQQDGLDVILEEDPRHVERTLGDIVRLAGSRVLVGENQVAVVAVMFDRRRGCVGVPRSLGVDGWNDRQEVLEFVVVGFGRGDGFVQWIEDRRVVRTEREFRDHMREIEVFFFVSPMSVTVLRRFLQQGNGRIE